MQTIVTYKKASPLAVTPSYAHTGDSGLDLFSIQDVFIPPMDSRCIDTGLIVEIPYGYEGQVRSKSGIALKNQCFVLNAPGTIDSGFRSTIQVILYNLSREEYHVEIGKKIAQLVICPVTYVALREGVLSETTRGTGGFGSTGLEQSQTGDVKEDKQLSFTF